MKRMRNAGVILFLFFMQVGLLQADEWSAFRKDARRSGVTEESPPLPLVRGWSYRPRHAPAPAWPPPVGINLAVKHGPLRQTLGFDRAFQVVTDGKFLFFGSSADDSVVSLDAATGALRWRFFTEGPVRLAPLLVGDAVVVGSDDGFLHSVDAEDGSLLWSYRAGPSSRRLPGNGRMISLWPVRGGVVEEGGILYGTAGLFPSEGVFLFALHAKTGREIWKREMPFSVQGPLMIAGERIFLPTGRTSIRSCARKDGRPLLRFGESDPWGKDLVGGSSGLATDDLLISGPSEDGQFHWFRPDGDKAVFQGHADDMILHGEEAFILGKEKLSAWSLKGGKPVGCKWSVDAPGMAAMIMAGDTLLAGGAGALQAFDGKNGKTLWREAIDGKVGGMAFAEGRLLVSLLDGRIVSFSSAKNRGAVREMVESSESGPGKSSDLFCRLAGAAVDQAVSKKGYCLVLQAGTGRLALEIARRSEYRILCLEETPEDVHRLREMYRGEGILGTRVAVHRGTLETITYPRYFANLIVSEGDDPPSSDRVLRVLRPCGGTVVLSGRDPSRLQEWGRSFPGWKVDGDGLGVARRGPLPGSGEWSHFYADPGNSACSNDEIRPGPMTLQWFGRPGPADMVDRHRKGQTPLAVNGRLFVPGFNYVAAVDAYNGFVLWEKRIPDSVRVGAFKDAEGMVATKNRLLMTAGNECLVMDADTGEVLRRIPAGDSKPWGYLGLAGERIVGSTARPGGSLRSVGKKESGIIWKNQQPVVCSDSIFSLSLNGEEDRREYRAMTGMIINPAIAIGGDRIFFVESGNRETLGTRDGRITLPDLLGKGSRLVSLDAGTGKEIWSVEVDLSPLEHVIHLSHVGDWLLVSGSRYEKVDPAETRGRKKPGQPERLRYHLIGFDARTGKERWRARATPSYDHVLSGNHGEQVQHPAVVEDRIYGPGFVLELDTGKPHRGWAWEKSHKCGTVSLSRHCAFSRFDKSLLPHLFDLKTGKKHPLTEVTRPGCWINMIPAGGMILIPEGSSGCTCGYSFQTSLGLIPEE